MFTGSLLQVTFKCNLNCTMCIFPQMHNRQRRELSTEEVISYLGTLPKSSELGLSGGEIFTRKDYEQIIIAASEKMSKIVLCTNATFPNELRELIKKLENAGTLQKLSVITSIDGARPETHDMIRGVKGAMSRTIESINLLQDFNIYTGANMVIQPKNYHEIWALYQLCKQMKIDFMCQMVEPRPSFTSSQIKEIYEQLKLVWEDLKNINTSLNYEYYLRGLLYYYLYEKRILPCYADKHSELTIDPLGDVYPCCGAPWIKVHDYGNPELVMGNVRDDSLMKIIDSERAEEVFKRLDSENCNSCWTARSYIPSLQYLQTLPEEEVMKFGLLNNSH